MELEKAKEIISTLYSIRIHENLFDLVDRCVGKSRCDINNIVRSEMKEHLTEFPVTIPHTQPISFSNSIR